MIPDYLARFWRSFDSVDENLCRSQIYENPDELGYHLVGRGTMATEETKAILCDEIMPAEEWRQLERNALDPERD